MAVAFYSSYAPGTIGGAEAPEEMAARVAERVNRELGGQPPEGGIYHAEGPTEEGGWWVFDVWASEEDYETFRRRILQPALDEAGVPVPSEVRRLRVWWDSSQAGGGS